MKKLTIVALVVVLVVSCLVFTGCGKKEDKKNDQYETFTYYNIFFIIFKSCQKFIFLVSSLNNAAG